MVVSNERLKIEERSIVYETCTIPARTYTRNFDYAFVETKLLSAHNSEI